MSYRDTIDYLYGLQKHGIKFGLDNITKLLACLGNPQASFRSVHIAGTNGKGSISAMIASILKAADFKVGLFTSPHLISFTERFRINNEQITESEVVELTEEIRLKMMNTGLNIPVTFFEFVTAMGFLYFKRKNVDWAVVETGMGGRLDATNVLIPEISVITGISYDHKEFLGNTIQKIAGEKAGIIKDNIPVVCAIQEKSVEEVIMAKTKEKSSPIFILGKDFHGVIKSSDINGITFDYIDPELRFPNSCLTDLFIPLAGEHQFYNACIAIKAATIALHKKIHDTPLNPPLARGEVKGGHASDIVYHESWIREGLASTRWPGRLEFISNGPQILIDGAHNPSAAKALADSLRASFLMEYKGLILIIGIMSDKDIEGIIAPLLPLASEIIFTAPNYERAAKPERLAEYASAMGYKNIHITQTVRDAIEMATGRLAFSVQRSATNSELSPRQVAERNQTSNSELILITGSFYTIGEAKEVLGEKSVLGSLRETL